MDTHEEDHEEETDEEVDEFDEEEADFDDDDEAGLLSEQADGFSLTHSSDSPSSYHAPIQHPQMSRQYDNSNGPFQAPRDMNSNAPAFKSREAFPPKPPL